MKEREGERRRGGGERGGERKREGEEERRRGGEETRRGGEEERRSSLLISEGIRWLKGKTEYLYSKKKYMKDP